MGKQVVTRTYRACICNYSQVRNDLDSLGFAASKLWNVGRWTTQRVWDACGHIPGANALMVYLKNHERYADLHSQSNQRVLQELGEAFTSWYRKRRNRDANANPPGYRKHNDDHPRSTITFKASGFKYDTHNNRIRLSKARTSKRIGETSFYANTIPSPVRQNYRERPASSSGVRTWDLAVAYRLPSHD